MIIKKFTGALIDYVWVVLNYEWLKEYDLKDVGTLYIARNDKDMGKLKEMGLKECPKSPNPISKMSALDFLKQFPYLPLGKIGKDGRFPLRPSNSEMFRWLKEGAVIINGKTPGPNDEIEYPITQLIFFPSSKKRRTVLR